MTPWIQNIARIDVVRGNHFAPGENSMLIQISDPTDEHPIPKHTFREVHQFSFLDLEDSAHVHAIKQTDADKLVDLLTHALESKMNVVVHCHAGICRSGAVCEVGVMLGFRDTEVFRSPNLLVKHMMMRKLGWLYDDDEPHTVNGTPVEEDWADDNGKVFTLAEARRKYRERYEGDI